MRYIKDIKEGDNVSEHYLCASKQILKTRVGKTYYSLLLQDKTGSMDTKIWELSDGIANFEAGDYVKVEGSVVSFQGGLQLNVRRLRKSQTGEVDPKEYVPTVEGDMEQMYQELLGYVDKIGNAHLSQLAKKFFVEDKAFAERFKTHTAAKTMHHNVMGGLLEHTLGILRMCEFLADAYPTVDRDLLFVGALFHDMGKTRELSSFPILEYTDEGQLVGHIVMAVEWIGEKIREIPGFPAPLANLVKHMVLAHHGELEYGSPKKPAVLEAVLLHYADNIDAKVQTFGRILSETDKESNWSYYQKPFESSIRRTRY
ncbi:3'-5' exoribonuclease YhaM family protein [Anaerotalea alkaliphila]|uniref:HD domain-containing protein n=1 Tax=Anaerotalea alkaliphila TaxID=2662126 RepID=A0A7X5KMA7_9FIRM|nr:HD domain-containing protein [Anaerotalea alkaliphila]NDL66764.1 HD domain-containing protein [Anaerotalea alkaliphila]